MQLVLCYECDIRINSPVSRTFICSRRNRYCYCCLQMGTRSIDWSQQLPKCEDKKCATKTKFCFTNMLNKHYTTKPAYRYSEGIDTHILNLSNI